MFLQYFSLEVSDCNKNRQLNDRVLVPLLQVILLQIGNGNFRWQSELN